MVDQNTIKILQTVAICFAGAFIIFKIASAIGGSNALASIRTQAADVVKNVPGGLVILNLCLDNLIAIAVILLAISVKMQAKIGFAKEGMTGYGDTWCMPTGTRISWGAYNLCCNETPPASDRCAGPSVADIGGIGASTGAVQSVEGWDMQSKTCGPVEGWLGLC